MELTGMMRRNPALFSGKFQEYITPKWLYRQLNEEFNFTLDPCTTKDNPLGAPEFYTKEDDGLKLSWAFERVYCNPPYGREISKWMVKAYKEVFKNCEVVVMLLPSRTGTKWFHEFVYPILKDTPDRVRFLKGRLKFEGVEKNTAPFDSMIVVFK